MFPGKIAWIVWLLVAASHLTWSQSGLEERLTTVDMGKLSPFEGKKFEAAKSAGNKTFASSKSDLTKEFSTESFQSKTFSDQKPNSTSQQKFKTETAAQTQQKFVTDSATVTQKSFGSQDFSQQSKSVSNADKTAPTRKMDTTGKTDGYWKAFKERLDKDLSMEEVRELLNKSK